MAEPPPRPRRDYIGFGVLLVAALVFVGAYLLFPVVQHWMSNQDCIASGRVNCG